MGLFCWGVTGVGAFLFTEALLDFLEQGDELGTFRGGKRRQDGCDVPEIAWEEGVH